MRGPFQPADASSRAALSPLEIGKQLLPQQLPAPPTPFTSRLHSRSCYQHRALATAHPAFCGGPSPSSRGTFSGLAHDTSCWSAQLINRTPRAHHGPKASLHRKKTKHLHLFRLWARSRSSSRLLFQLNAACLRGFSHLTPKSYISGPSSIATHLKRPWTRE